ncbi:MAG: hypothetical protein ACI4B3_11455 [Prevotella sp.]
MNKTDKKWRKKYKEVWNFVTEHHRGPTRHHPEEASLLNWMKYNRKRMNKDILQPDRKELLLSLRNYISSFCRVNQYC